MAGDELATLGLEIRAEAAEWMGGLLGGFVLPGAEAAAEPIAELVMLERAVAALAGQVAELEQLESALTAGFPGTPSPAPPADAAAEEPEEEGPRGTRRGRDGNPWIAPAPPSPAVDRTWGRGLSAADAGPSRIPPGASGRGDAGPPAAPPSSSASTWPTAPHIQSPPPSSSASTWPPAPQTQPARGLDLPFSAPPDERGSAGPGKTAPSIGSPRAKRGPGAAPSIGGGIRGIGDLASLVGSAGLDLPPDAEQPSDSARRDLPRPSDVRQASGQRGWEDAGDVGAASAPRQGSAPGSDEDPGRDRSRGRTAGAAWDGASGSTEAETRGDEPHPAPAPIRRRAWDQPESGGSAGGRDAASGPAGESHAGFGDQAARDERRWDDLPRSLAGLARSDALTLGLLDPRSIALPFLSMPGEPDADASPERGGASAGADRASGGRGAIDRDPSAFPAPRQQGSASAAAWPAGTESSGNAASQAWIDEFSADPDPLAAPGLARTVGRRVRPAAEILSALGEGALTVESAPRLEGSAEWPTLAPEPAERPAPEPGAAPDPRPRAADDEPPVAIVRSVEPAPPDAFPEPSSWPDLDVQDLMDALAREIMHEYRRYYG